MLPSCLLIDFTRDFTQRLSSLPTVSLQPDYSALISKIAKRGGRGKAGSALSSALSYGKAYDRRDVLRQKQAAAALRIQAVFRGWRQRVYNNINALRYEVMKRKDRAIAKAWKKAKDVVMGEVSTCLGLACS